MVEGFELESSLWYHVKVLGGGLNQIINYILQVLCVFHSQVLLHWSWLIYFVKDLKVSVESVMYSDPKKRSVYTE